MIERKRAIESCYLIPGWCFPRELGAIYDLVRGSRLHVELGSFCGRSLAVTAHAMHENGRVVAVDPLLLDDAPYTVLTRRWVEDVFAATIRAIGEVRGDILIDHVRATALDAAGEWTRGPATSIFFDEEKNYAELLADLEAWYPHIDSGGVMLGHDYWSVNPGVIEAVEEFFGTRSLPVDVIPQTRLWIHRKQ